MNLLDEKIKLEKMPEIIPKAVTPKKESPPPINLNEIFKKKEEKEVLKNDDSSSSYQNEIENLEKFEEPEAIKNKIESFIEDEMPEEDFLVINLFKNYINLRKTKRISTKSKNKNYWISLNNLTFFQISSQKNSLNLISIILSETLKTIFTIC